MPTYAGHIRPRQCFQFETLEGSADPLPPDHVVVPQNLITNLPMVSGYGCKDLGIATTDRALGIQNQIPSDFNPRPKTNLTPAQ